MDAELKAKWVAALRSGEYRQGKRLLHDEDHNTYCCLGVLCALIGKQSADRHMVSHKFARSIGCRIYNDDKGQGFPLAQLSHMNDSGQSFAEIADYIERNL